MKIPFCKPYTSPPDLVELQQSRGLTIEDAAKAQHYLQHIGYYRLSAYMYPFLRIPKKQHRYKPEATFRKVMMLYRFDKKLRLFIFNEIEKVEVAIRCAIVNVGCEITGDPFWMTDSQNFTNQTKYLQTMRLVNDELRRSREDFINHFKQNYTNDYPPAWMLSEILPFGVMTNLYDNVRNMRIKKKVAQKFGLQVAPFESWMTIITLTRNSCCHHARVWNKQNTIRPMLPNRINHPWINLSTDLLRVYFDLCIIKYFLNIISPMNDMTKKLKSLLAEYPDVDTCAMGFPMGWQTEPLWGY
ncbi:MAG: Abi family protein [Paludibacteraceae bacterium]|nr:Abi family protein [Paludibacteraceae bacterium]